MTIASSSTDFIAVQFKKVAFALRALRLIFSAVGVILIAVGQSLQNSTSEVSVGLAGYVFWAGVGSILLTGVILAFFERDSVSLTLRLRELEQKASDQGAHISYMKWREEMFLTWLDITKLLSELLDQALTTEPLTSEKRQLIFTAVVEILADYKLSMFGIGEEYCNISLYQKAESGLLECVACYRSRPSDANVEHRKWKVGEGHVGKAYELQRELICANANSPDVKPWISASPDNYSEQDEARYVSLAAVPTAANAEEPIGVLIVTSSEPMRFANSDENHGDDDLRERRRISVAALQDFAAQVGQIMLVLEGRRVSSTAEAGLND